MKEQINDALCLARGLMTEHEHFDESEQIKDAIHLIRELETELKHAAYAAQAETERADQLEQQLAAEREANRWVPVGERLPTDDWIGHIYSENLGIVGRVKFSAETDVCYLRWYILDQDFDVFDELTQHQVTHWREIKPPADANA